MGMWILPRLALGQSTDSLDPVFESEWDMDTIVDEAAAARPLFETFPGLIQCDPPDTAGCISRCHKSVDKQPTDFLKMCGMVRCISDCTKNSAGDCADAGVRACESIRRTMELQEFICYVDCTRTSSR